MGKFSERVGTEVAPARPRGEAPQPSGWTPMAVGEAEAGGLRIVQSGGEKRWAANHEQFWGATSTYDTLPSGVYRCDWNNQLGAVLIRQVVETDHLLTLPDAATNEVLAEFDRFWASEKAFADRRYVFKRGFLLWGPPGGGKTSTVQLLVQKVVQERQGVVVYMDNPGVAAACLQMLRSIERHRPLIAVMEDFDSLVEKWSAQAFLAMLDGEAQVGNIVFLATTNYPERLERRFVDRPSRFDTIMEIGMPTAEARAVYLKHKEPSLTPDEIERWVELSEDFSIAHLKELVIAVKCLGQTVEFAVERMREMMEQPPKSGNGADKPKTGFIGKRTVRWRFNPDEAGAAALGN